MKEFLGKQVTEEEHGMGIAYLLENNELFYDIGYKVMQNLEETYQLKCHRLKYNGKIKLVYLSFFRIYINSHMGIIKYGGRLWTLTYTKILKRELTVRFT